MEKSIKERLRKMDKKKAMLLLFLCVWLILVLPLPNDGLAGEAFRMFRLSLKIAVIALVTVLSIQLAMKRIRKTTAVKLTRKTQNGRKVEKS